MDIRKKQAIDAYGTQQALAVAHLAHASRLERPANLRRCLRKWPDRARDHVDDRALPLQVTIDEQQGVSADHAPEFRPD